MGNHSSIAWSRTKLAKLLIDKIRQAYPTTTVVGSEDIIKTRFTPVKALKYIRVVFAVVDGGFMLVERIDFFFWKMSEKFSGKIILGTKWLKRLTGIFRSKGRGITTKVRKLERQNLSMPSTSDSTRSEILLSLLHSAN